MKTTAVALLVPEARVSLHPSGRHSLCYTALVHQARISAPVTRVESSTLQTRLQTLDPAEVHLRIRQGYAALASTRGYKKLRDD